MTETIVYVNTWLGNTIQNHQTERASRTFKTVERNVAKQK